MKKLFYILSGIVFIILVVNLVSIQYDLGLWDVLDKKINRIIRKVEDPYSLKWVRHCSDKNNQEIDCKKCVKNGGIIFPHSFGKNCEIEAKDANMPCTYDSECVKYHCIYEDKNASSGYCDGYLGDNDGFTQCHRAPGQAVLCDGYIS